MICKNCGKTDKEVTFHGAGTFRDGRPRYKKVCGTCTSLARGAKPRALVKVVEGKIKCSSCGETKETTRFRTNKNSAAGYTSVCKKCIADKRRERVEAIIRELYPKRVCEDCGFEGHNSQFDFHHRDPASKLFDISKARQRNMAKDVILRELKKCVLLCANCHRLHHISKDDPQYKA